MKDAVDLMLDTSSISLADQSAFITQSVIDAHDQNDNLAALYGDTTTFTEVDGPNDLGMRNWIATLPYFKLVNKVQPFDSEDEDRDINHTISRT